MGFVVTIFTSRFIYKGSFFVILVANISLLALFVMGVVVFVHIMGVVVFVNVMGVIVFVFVMGVVVFVFVNVNVKGVFVHIMIVVGLYRIV